MWILFSLLPTIIHQTSCHLLEMVDDIASFDNSTQVGGTEMCVLTTGNSTLDETAPFLLSTVMSKYPTTFVNNKLFIDIRTSKLASVVLLDLTGFPGEFPRPYVQQHISHHPCYKKPAKFIILLSEFDFQRKDDMLQFLKNYGILNYVAVSIATGSLTNGTFEVYTENQFTHQEYFFRSDDRPVSRFFPNKFLDLNGYVFRMHSWLDQDEFRKSFMHNFYLRQMTGDFLLCPVRTERDVLGHLLKPFSSGIWGILGAIFVFCKIIQFLFPKIYRYDLISITFFGGGGTEYQQPFAFRAVMLTLTVLVFFLSEAYLTKIISLMSLAPYRKPPHTIAEVAASDYRILGMKHKDFPLYYYDSGIWSYKCQYFIDWLNQYDNMHNDVQPFHEVIFLLNDLASVWMLLGVGWCII
ncbi:uncharacterized protein LOC131216018 [Anopheles bellator]|uniref:uncharacterized protein LOC131216018 n=1 Tax=Anopheles bellator TaxID=139047 RepID=UPI002648AC09|nr:uncharacterized protein LOC131216018 [Anopheles bellator]